MGEAMGRPKVSVVVPIYKVEKYLVRCLESVVDQTLRDLEIILVDEGDQDRCREIIDFYEQTDSRVITIHEPNPNASYGAKVNRGLDRATGEFVAIVESDDFIGLEMYEQMYACAVRTGANIVKTPFYNYRSKDDNEVDKSRGYVNAYVPKEKPFSIFQFPYLLAMHPSPWSALYRREELVRQGVRCLEAPGAGYVDNPFYVDAYVRLGRIVWLNKPFYRWRQTSGTSSSRPENWNRQVMLERWERNLDMYPIQTEAYSVFGPYFANKAWTSILRHYLDGWQFNEEEYAAMTAFLRRFSEEQIMSAARVSQEHREMMLLCRNDPEQFRAEYLTPGGVREEAQAPEQEQAEEPPEEQKAEEPTEEKKREELPPRKAEPGRFLGLLADRDFATAVFRGAGYLLLMALALEAGAFGGLLPEPVCGPLAAACAVLSALCVPVLTGCFWAARRTKKRRSAPAGKKSAG